MWRFGGKLDDDLVVFVDVNESFSIPQSTWNNFSVMDG